jgi:hypothetical protein
MGGKKSTASSSASHAGHSHSSGRKHKHKLGQQCLYYSDRGATPQAGQVVHLHEDGTTACLAVWCAKSSAYLPRYQVPHLSCAFASGPHWTCIDEEPAEEGEDEGCHVSHG